MELCSATNIFLVDNFPLLQGSGWKVVASFEGNFPNRIKQLPLDRHFDINNVKRVGLHFQLHSGYISSHLLIFSWGALHLHWLVLIILGCPRSRWLSTLSYISGERVKVLNKKCPRDGKGTITSMRWWGMWHQYSTHMLDFQTCFYVQQLLGFHLVCWFVCCATHHGFDVCMWLNLCNLLGNIRTSNII